MVEVWHLDPEAIMAMPSSRRYRLLLRKMDLEKKRQSKKK